jgi:hypothetical protein
MGISWKGILITALVLFPNVFFMLLPKQNMPSNLSDGGLLTNILEHGSRIVYFILIITMTKNSTVRYLSLFLFLMIASLIIYYILWIRYFANGMDFRLLFDTVLHVPLPMAVFPILFLLFSALWLNSIPLTITAVLFGIGHILNSYIVHKQIL